LTLLHLKKLDCFQCVLALWFGIAPLLEFDAKLKRIQQFGSSMNRLQYFQMRLVFSSNKNGVEILDLAKGKRQAKNFYSVEKRSGA